MTNSNPKKVKKADKSVTEIIAFFNLMTKKVKEMSKKPKK